MVLIVTLLLTAVQEVVLGPMAVLALELPDKEITAELLCLTHMVVVVVRVLLEQMHHQVQYQETVERVFNAHYHP